MKITTKMKDLSSNGVCVDFYIMHLPDCVIARNSFILNTFFLQSAFVTAHSWHAGVSVACQQNSQKQSCSSTGPPYMVWLRMLGMCQRCT